MARISERYVARTVRLGALFGVVNRPEALTWLYGETDKGPHGYLPYYRRHLGPRRWERLVAFEIGVGMYESSQAGGSLPIWRDYLLRSKIVGIDLYPKEIKFGRRVTFARADQNEPDELRAVVDEHGRPDVVIDDGSHIGRHIKTSFECLWPLLNPGGLYVIEDLSTAYSASFEGGHPVPEDSSIRLLQLLVDNVQARDPAFVMYPQHASAPDAPHDDVAAVHVYPGIAFIEKAA